MGVTRFTAAVAAMRGPLRKRCATVNAAMLALDEEGRRETRPAADVREQLQKLAAGCRAACDQYNKLRSLTAELERAEGEKQPRFSVGEYRETGEPICSGGRCDCGRLTPTAKEMEPR
jgi:hypothetical protein